MTKIHDKIRHMLAIAQDPSAGEAEREQAMSRAHKLMLEHGIEIAEEQEARGIEYSSREFMCKGVYSSSILLAIQTILEPYEVFFMLAEDIPRTSSMKYYISGPAAQMEEVTSVIESIRVQMEDERKRWMKTIPSGTRAYQKRQIRSFYFGYGMKVRDRIEQSLKVSSSSKAALVRVGDQARDHLLEKLGAGGVKTSRGHKVTMSGYAAGAMAGERAKLRPELS